MAYSPQTKMEVWCFTISRLKRPNGKDCYRRLGFNLVSWDGAPEQYIEPVCDISLTHEHNAASAATTASGAGNIAGFEIFEGEPFLGVTEFKGNV